MKWIALLGLLMLPLFAADIDVKLFEGDQKVAYYDELLTRIETDEKSEARSKEIIADEKRLLARVRSAATQVVQIERYELTAVSKKSVEPEPFYNALNGLASLRLKQERQHELLNEIQSKLLFLKQQIEHITEEEKPKLLYYQLHFAYYKLQYSNIETKIGLLEAHANELMGKLVDALVRLECNKDKNLESRLAESNEKIEQAVKKRIALQLDREKAAIEESGKQEQITEQIGLADERYNMAVSEKIKYMTLQSLCMLQQRQNRAFFKRLGNIEEAVASSMKDQQPLYKEQNAVLREMAKGVFGSTRLLMGATFQEGREMWRAFKEYFTSSLFVYNERPISFLSLTKAVILVLLGIMAGVLYKRWVLRIASRWPDMSQMSVRLASNIGYYLIIIIAFMIAISSIGIDMTSISLIAGALSIGIGFGLQTVVSNLIAGIILMFERTIRIGDTIEINDSLRGKVTDMRIRSTTIKTFDNIDIVVPNSSFIQNNVINWTLEDRTRRLHIPFGVAYGTEVERVKKAILDELEECDLKYIKNDSDKAPEVWMVGMNSSSVDFELLVWVEWASRLRPNALKSDFLILIYNALYKNGIQIPFPQLDLHVKDMPKRLT